MTAEPEKIKSMSDTANGTFSVKTGGVSAPNPSDTVMADHPSKRDRAPRTTRRMAYLGPQGTYGQQAAQDFQLRLGSHLNHPSGSESQSHLDFDIELVPYPSIQAVYEADTDYRVLPLENTIHGVVIETLDCLLSLLSPTLRSKTISTTPNSNTTSTSSTSLLPRILGDTVLKIQHLLVARKGVSLSSVSWVRSHEQALGQSSLFLSTHLPSATLQTWPSTAGAVSSLLAEGSHLCGDNDDKRKNIEIEKNEEKPGQGAAICSKVAFELYKDQLDILYEGTQSVAHNYTRFILLTNDTSTSLLPPTQSQTHPSVSTSFYLLSHPSSLGSLLYPNQSLDQSSFGSPIRTLRAVHGKSIPELVSRNDPFPRHFLVEIELHTNENEQSEGVPIGLNDQSSHDDDGVLSLGSFPAYSISIIS